MEKVIETEKIPIKMWIDEIEENALEQAKNLANLPFAVGHIALMPDCHSGYGMPIGGVLATKGVVIPNAVGVDIGCGMCAVKTSLKDITTDELKGIMGKIRKYIPVGFEHHKKAQSGDLMPDSKNMGDVVKREYSRALKQLGTLGGGNHFIEILKGSDGFVWIMIHSGSRNLGKQVANYYDKKARELNKKKNSNVPSKWNLAFLSEGTRHFKRYIKEMQYCIDFAFENRYGMMERVKEIFEDKFKDISFDEMINIAHNYAQLEHFYNEDLWIHRKGATSARKGEIGIIPGSMGTKSYIVEGLGNKESFESCSHGAGRIMSRKAAINTLDLEKENKRMEGILGGPRHQSELDEAPSAYKDIDSVMKFQEDLVSIVTTLEPVAVIKG